MVQIMSLLTQKVYRFLYKTMMAGTSVVIYCGLCKI